MATKLLCRYLLCLFVVMLAFIYATPTPDISLTLLIEAFKRLALHEFTFIATALLSVTDMAMSSELGGFSLPFIKHKAGRDPLPATRSTLTTTS